MRNNETAKQLNYETTKEGCKATKGRYETTILRNNKTVKQRKSDAKQRDGPIPTPYYDCHIGLYLM